MSVAIDNTGLTDYRGDQGIGSFNPVVTFTLTGNTLAVQDGTTGFPAGDSLRRVHVKAQDGFGGEVRGTITVTGAPGAQNISVATLRRERGLKVVATVVTVQGIAADGSISNIGASGSIGSWDIQKNA